MPLFLTELRTQASQLLGILGLRVAFPCLAFADSFLMIEALSVLLLPSLDIFVLRLRDNVLAYTQYKRFYSTNHPETSSPAA